MLLLGVDGKENEMRVARWKITRGNKKTNTFYGGDAEAMTQLCCALAYGEKCVVEPDNAAARMPSNCRKTRREWEAHARYVRSRNLPNAGIERPMVPQKGF